MNSQRRKLLSLKDIFFDLSSNRLREDSSKLLMDSSLSARIDYSLRSNAFAITASIGTSGVVCTSSFTYMLMELLREGTYAFSRV